MTLREACTAGSEKLREAGIEEAALDAWYLLEHVTGISRAAYLADPSRELEGQQKRDYFFYIEERCRRIPLQHLTGEQEFMGLRFRVNEHVLIPRQDTEVLVETALEFLKRRAASKERAASKKGSALKESAASKESAGQGQRLLDMCTGSGCILISLLRYMKQGSVTGIGADISGKVLETAALNAKELGVWAQAAFIRSDLFERVEGQYDVIVANPPYIRTAVIGPLQEEVRGHDPILALDGKEDGLHFYRRIVAQSGSYLKTGGGLFFEIGVDQGADVADMMRQAGYQDVTVKKDVAGLVRVVLGVYDK